MSRFRLFYHRSSSASLRVTIFLACRGVPSDVVELVSTGFKTDHRGIPVFTMPEGHEETEKIGTDDLTAFNPEGRIPVLLANDGRIMTQSGPILSRVLANMIAEPVVSRLLEEAGGVVQPYAFDPDKFEVYVKDADV